jgi:hypothetical protein
MNVDDIFHEMGVQHEGASLGDTCTTIDCPHCGKPLTVYLNIDFVEVDD